MKFKYFLPVIMIVFFVQGCRIGGVKGSGNIIEANRVIEDFEIVEISGAYDVDISVGKTASLEIVADDNLMKYIETEVRGNKLTIRSKKNLRPRNEIEIFITTPNLIKIESSGASSIKAYGIDNDIFQTELSGAGSINLSGRTEKFRADMSGAGNVNAKELKAEYVKVGISGACSAVVYASKAIKADVSGVGSIDYYGDPEDVESSVSGVGSINRK